jgi:hypothetical protein
MVWVVPALVKPFGILRRPTFPARRLGEQRVDLLLEQMRAVAQFGRRQAAQFLKRRLGLAQEPLAHVNLTDPTTIL